MLAKTPKPYFCHTLSLDGKCQLTLQETRKETRQRQIAKKLTRVNIARKHFFKMLDFFTIFSKGGILLFCFKGFGLDKKAWESFVYTVNSLNKTVFLQVRILP